jgi:glutamate dehydrogenase/leucine dehydrogenase
MATATPERLVIPESVDESFESIIHKEFGEAAQQANELDHMGIEPSELLEAFEERPATAVILKVRDPKTGVTMEFPSWRHQVGALDETDDGSHLGDSRSRGGLELSSDVSSEKIRDKALAMYVKHLIGGTGNIGGKSGIQATPEQLEYLKTQPEIRRDLFRQYALAHNINPFTNVTATDIGTFGPDMDAIVEALLGKAQFGDRAGAAASGASSRYGGLPEWHGRHTGAGADIVLDRYLQRLAASNPRVQEAVTGGRPLRVLIQGLGKAGAHTLLELPSYVQPAGAYEYRGGAVAPEDGVLNRQQLLGAARAGGLDKASVAGIDGARWLEADKRDETTKRSDFWASGAHLLAPSYDRYQVTAEDVTQFKRLGGIAILSVANHPLTDDAKRAARELHVDEIPDVVANSGGTRSSQSLWDRYMSPQTWDPETAEADWRQGMIDMADAVFDKRDQLSQKRGGEFVSLDEAVKLVVVERAVQRLRGHKARQQLSVAA